MPIHVNKKNKKEKEMEIEEMMFMMKCHNNNNNNKHKIQQTMTCLMSSSQWIAVPYQGIQRYYSQAIQYELNLIEMCTKLKNNKGI